VKQYLFLQRFSVLNAVYRYTEELRHSQGISLSIGIEQKEDLFHGTVSKTKFQLEAFFTTYYDRFTFIFW
jgi:hypothetical protein